MRISDGSSDVCSSDLPATAQGTILYGKGPVATVFYNNSGFPVTDAGALIGGLILALVVGIVIALMLRLASGDLGGRARATVLFALAAVLRSEESRLGTEGGSTGRSRWLPYILKKNKPT